MKSLWFVLLFLSASPCWAAPCATLYQRAEQIKVLASRSRGFGKASKCFYLKFKSTAERNEKGRALRNAIFALHEGRKANLKFNKPLESDKLGATILKWIQLHNALQQQNKLRSTGEANSVLRRIQKKVTPTVGFATLILISKSKSALLCYSRLEQQAQKHCFQSTLVMKKVLAGRYKVSANFEGISLPRTHILKLKRFEVKPHDLTPPLANLTVVTGDPNATIYVSNSKQRETLIAKKQKTFKKLLIGNYKITVDYNGHKLQRTVQLEANKPLPPVVFEPPPPVFVKVNTMPKGASIYLGKMLRGQAPVNLPLRMGTYILRIEKHCYTPYIQPITIKSPSDSQTNIVMNRDPAWITRKLLLKEHRDRERRLKRVGIWLSSLGTAFVVASAITLGAGIDQVSQAAKLRESQGSLQQHVYLPQGQYGNVLNGTGLALGGLGLGALGPGLWLWLRPKTPFKSKLRCQTPKTKTTIGPSR